MLLQDFITYSNHLTELFCGDSLDILPLLPDSSVDVVFADPPYFLSNNGISCASGRMVSVNKGKWDQGLSLEERHSFNISWISLCYQKLKPTGTIWISGTLHNIYSIGMALEMTGFQVINNITWQKSNPPPNLACKTFTHSTETILWAKKRNAKKYIFNYQTMKTLNNNKQMKDVWTGSLTSPSEKKHGKHPTQKPEYLLNLILTSSTNVNSLVVDPFCGSGTTGVVANKLNRRFVGIDKEPDFIRLAQCRIEEVNGT
jgi:site-specific DNA-methyltransferase (adenine-specific)